MTEDALYYKRRKLGGLLGMTMKSVSSYCFPEYFTKWLGRSENGARVLYTFENENKKAQCILIMCLVIYWGCMQVHALFRT